MRQNGNIVNTAELRRHLRTDCPPSEGSDSELLLCLFIGELKHQYMTPGSSTSVQTSIFNALSKIYELCHGSFACVMMISGLGLVGFRDAHGIKPLVYGERHNSDGSIDYMFGSESVALNKLDFKNIRDVEPGMFSCPTYPAFHQLQHSVNKVADLYQAKQSSFQW
jgi:amidophosphoribosyltransferase